MHYYFYLTVYIVVQGIFYCVRLYIFGRHVRIYIFIFEFSISVEFLILLFRCKELFFNVSSFYDGYMTNC